MAVPGPQMTFLHPCIQLLAFQTRTSRYRVEWVGGGRSNGEGSSGGGGGKSESLEYDMDVAGSE